MLFADFLNYAMEQTNLSNYKLAKQIGVSQTSVANWREGGREPRKKPKAAVLSLFGVTEEDISGDEFPLISYSDDRCAPSGQKETPPAQGGGLSEKDKRLIDWFRSLPPEKQKAILVAQDGPEDAVE